MKLKTELDGPTFLGVKGTLFTEIKKDGADLQFIFCLGKGRWAGFCLEKSDRGTLRVYDKKTNVTDRVESIGLAEALGLVRAGLSLDGTLNHISDAGKTGGEFS